MVKATGGREIRVKICGIKTLEEALEALEAGADLLGFNFYPPSPRYLPPLACTRILLALQDRQLACESVGVFVNEPVATILAILEECGLNSAQLSGDEPPELVAELSGRAFKAIRPEDPAQALAEATRYKRNEPAPALLVDAHSPGQYGGSGQTGDWGAARSLARRYPVLLAGGLNPDNVAAALAQVEPWGVDVASGVESSPGRKDPAKMKAFVQAVRTYTVERTAC